VGGTDSGSFPKAGYGTGGDIHCSEGGELTVLFFWDVGCEVLKMEAIRFSKTLVSPYESIRRHNPRVLEVLIFRVLPPQ
jgi:hypothetical protein